MEVGRGLGAAEHRRRIVDLDRIGHRQDAARARLHPERLIVGRPVHQERIAVLLQQVGSDGRLRNPRAHPTIGTSPATLGHRPGRVRDHGGLGRFIHVGLALGVGIAVADDFVATLTNARGDLRHLFADRRIEQMAYRPLQFVHHIENAPDADAQAVVAPAEIANIGLRAERRRRMAEAFAKAEMLDIQRAIEGDALVVRPREVLPLGDRRIGVAIVFLQFHGGRALCFDGDDGSALVSRASVARRRDAAVQLQTAKQIGGPGSRTARAVLRPGRVPGSVSASLRIPCARRAGAGDAAEHGAGHQAGAAGIVEVEDAADQFARGVEARGSGSCRCRSPGRCRDRCARRRR